jgi:hypothetical protein
VSQARYRDYRPGFIRPENWSVTFFDCDWSFIHIPVLRVFSPVDCNAVLWVLRALRAQLDVVAQFMDCEAPDPLFSER